MSLHVILFTDYVAYPETIVPPALVAGGIDCLLHFMSEQDRKVTFRRLTKKTDTFRFRLVSANVTRITQ